MKNKDGITLVALVLTIVIMVILAGITSSAIMGENGIVNQARKSKINTENSGVVELIEMAWSARMTAFMENGENIDRKQLAKLMTELNANLRSSGEIVAINFDSSKKEYSLIYESPDNKNYIVTVSEIGKAEVAENSPAVETVEDAKNNYDVVVDNVENIIEDRIFAAYYPTEKRLVFSNNNRFLTNDNSSDKIVWNSIDNDFIVDNSVSELAWYNYRTNIETVNVMNKIYPSSTESWFYDFSSLTSIENMSNLNFKEAVAVKGMFQNCSSLTSLDLRNFDIFNVTSLSSMFRDCSSLNNIEGLSNWDTSKIIDFSYLFANTNLFGDGDLNELENWKTSSAIYMQGMFMNCENIESIIAIDTHRSPEDSWEIEDICWYVGNVINFGDMFEPDGNGMFQGCVNLSEFSDFENIMSLDVRFGMIAEKFFYQCPSHPEFFTENSVSGSDYDFDSFWDDENGYHIVKDYKNP